MAYLNPLNTVHPPVTTDGNLIKNNFGVVIAKTTDAWIATAMAELINLAAPVAKEQEQQRQAREDRLATAILVDMVRNSPR